jgi:hypothetical protein
MVSVRMVYIFHGNIFGDWGQVFCFSFQQLGLCKDRDVVGERCPIKIIDSDLLAEGRVWIINCVWWW